MADLDSDHGDGSHLADLVPRPDPSILTSRLIRTGLDDTKELLRAEIHARGQLTDAKIDAINKATVLLQTIADRLPVMVDDKLSTLRELHGERFDSIKTQFLERDTRTEQTSRDSKVAVDAALQAAKEAVGKSQEASDRAVAKQEMATTKLLEQITTLISSNNKALDDKANDLKDRLNRIEGGQIGHKDSITSTMTMMGIAIAVLGLVFGYGIFKGTTPIAAAPVAVVVPSTFDQAQSAEIAALTRLLSDRAPTSPAK